MASADIIEWYAEEGRRAYGRIVPGRGKGVRQIVVQEPVGIVAAFTPWNFPALTPARKIGGALAAGCSLILKASEETPGACVEMVRCFADAGIPAGVLNLVFGVPATISEHLIAKDDVRKISFTGSIPVGKHLAALAGQAHEARHDGIGRPLAGRGVCRRRPGEVGGHHRRRSNPATPAKCASRRRDSMCRKPVYDRFLDALHRIRQSDSSVGDGLEKGVGMGPLVSARRIDAMENCSSRRQKSRRQNRYGRPAPRQPGLFLRADRDHRCAGRLQDHDRGAIRPACAGGHLQDHRRGRGARQFAALRARRLCLHRLGATANMIGEVLQSGMVGVNSINVSTPETPFGGIKESGYGSEGGLEGLQAYLNTKFISQA